MFGWGQTYDRYKWSEKGPLSMAENKWLAGGEITPVSRVFFAYSLTGRALP